eukprot:TRINITY_DN64358_c0_g1_i2.p2 TRINITY_DN64358_c0_g1~~TRINITY_DN64358_c0_g1_i2.p2  ORF type:complete len:324 (-),score=37.04 TRINITY_DN64358_c0_g1_i2:1545-2444(-)
MMSAVKTTISVVQGIRKAYATANANQHHCRVVELRLNLLERILQELENMHVPSSVVPTVEELLKETQDTVTTVSQRGVLSGGIKAQGDQRQMENIEKDLDRAIQLLSLELSMLGFKAAKEAQTGLLKELKANGNKILELQKELKTEAGDTVQPQQYQLVQLKAFNGKYVTAEKEGKHHLTTRAAEAQDWEQFVLEQLSDKVALMATHIKQYVRAPDGDAPEVYADRNSAKADQQFVMEHHGGNMYSFKSRQGRYLSAKGDNQRVGCDAAHVADQEKFEVSFNELPSLSQCMAYLQQHGF